jgi:signal transduction histidine kinase
MDPLPGVVRATTIKRYTVAVASTVASLAIAMLVGHPLARLSPFFLFYAAVALSAWYGGTMPGLLSVALGALAAIYFLLPPLHVAWVQQPDDIARLALFACVGALIAILNGALHRSRERYEREAAIARRAEAEIRMQQDRLQALSSELMMAEERERRRIAGVLHDTVVQMLAVAKLKTDSLRRNPQCEAQRPRLEEVLELIERSITHSRLLTAELSPPVLYELGLAAAVQWLGDRLRQQHGVSFEMISDRQRWPLSEQTKVVLFQAVRELMVNVIKHARASRCVVRLARDGEMLKVQVEDNGQGFDPDRRQVDYMAGGFGLFNIRQRLVYLGGSLQVESRHGAGAIATMYAPLQATRQHEKSEGVHDEHQDPVGRRSPVDAPGPAVHAR